jgi:hypothetical protein
MIMRSFPAGERHMTRLFAAAILLATLAAPAIACEYNKSASTDTKPSTVASQPADDHPAPPPANHQPS